MRIFNWTRASAFDTRSSQSRRMLFSATVLAIATVATAIDAKAQGKTGNPGELDSLVASALVTNPDLAAARSRVTAARARIAPAGSRPDPMLMAGLINVPVNNFSLTDDDMTMKMIGVTQTVPYPGKLRLARRIAELEANELAVEIDTVRLSVVRDVKVAYYEIAYIDAALQAAHRIDSLSANVVKAAELRYAAGRGAQQDVLRATLDATRLNETANGLIQQRVALAEKIGALGGGKAPSLPSAKIPARVVSAAVDSDPSVIRFSSFSLGAAVAAGPLPPLVELQTLAVIASPQVRRQVARNAVVAAQLELARRQHLPDFDFSLQYGQRSGTMTDKSGMRVGRPDMVSFVVSIPVPIQRGTRQEALVTAAQADMTTGDAERRASESLVRSEVGRLYSDATRARTQLALYVKALIPQARASLASSVNAYQSGTGDLTAALEARRTLLDMEVGYHRAMADFAERIAELDSMTGQETLR